MSIESGVLYVVATPIGNLGDITERARRVLESVDRIAAEDTRHSAHLLQHFAITTPCTALHEHNEEAMAPRLVEALQNGESVALISDAGTPLVSDPGFRLVRLARQHGVRVVPVPGASAVLAALSVSGLPSDRFVFEGFLPARGGPRRQRLETLRHESRTLVFYEAPHRILETLRDMAEVLGADREAVLARELTKTFETVRGATLTELAAWVEADPNQQKGEIVLLLHGVIQGEDERALAEAQRVLELLLEELPLKQAAALAARITGARKNDLYRQALECASGRSE